MKKMIALLLCLCFALGGCAQSAPIQHTEEDGGVTPAPVVADSPASPAESFDQLALRLAALPELPEEPNEEVLWAELGALDRDALGEDGYNEAYDKLWQEFSAKQDAYYDAVGALRGDGVDDTLTPAFLAYTLRTAELLFDGASEKNVVYSPANLYLALCMLCETTDGETRAQLLDLLGLSDVEQARDAANTLWRTLYRDSATDKTLLANSIWLNEQFSFRQDTVDRLASDYYASTFRAKMGDRTTDAAIAEWINENTNHLLENAANGLKTNPDTLMMLISTLYFKGTWRSQFSEFATEEDVFTAADGTEQRVDFMHKSVDRGTYYRGDTFTVAYLPFTDGKQMWFLLPDEGVTLESLLSGEAVDLASLSDPSAAEIRWSVPKFDVDSDLDLIPALKTLGVTDVFDKSAADFSPLTELDAVVSAVKHAARVKVDEEGCEAAAFTAISVETTAMMPERLPVIEMDLNRPFGFLITGVDGLPLFVGAVNTAE
ncbi:MAG: serpin family protein [Ruminococcaceae bacterium]|nr:serpin family protein [Oscillospiraceae bacterium]